MNEKGIRCGNHNENLFDLELLAVVGGFPKALKFLKYTPDNRQKGSINKNNKKEKKKEKKRVKTSKQIKKK